MTIRAGGGPRDDGPDRGRPRPMAHRLDAGPTPAVEPGPVDAGFARDRDRLPAPRAAGPAGRPANGRAGARAGDHGGHGGALRFLLFLVVTGGVVLVLLGTVLRPIVKGIVVGYATSNPGALGLPFVADLVREDLGDALTRPASDDPTQVPFTVEAGETASRIAERLKAAGLLQDARAFVFVATEKGLTGQLSSGDFVLRRNMTPEQLVGSLLQAEDPAVVLEFKPGLRIEQVTAYLQMKPDAIASLKMDAAAFYTLVTKPPARLLADYPWLDIPRGGTLEGYLAGGLYRVLPDTTPEELVRDMLDRWYANVGPERLAVPKARGLTWYQALTLASIVQREAALDAERPTIAGVYQGRLDRDMLLNADPTVVYAVDSLALRALPVSRWPDYFFWSVPKTPLAEVALPHDLAGYQTYAVRGLPAAPIATPTVASIDAALAPDTARGYLYFVAIPDGGGAHDFSKTYEEHKAKLKKYGYLK